MSASHVINYFGKVTDIQNIEVRPELFKKGNVRLAIYGIGHMKDDRLNLALSSGKIKFVDPDIVSEESDENQDWFKILVLHQNRFKGLAVGQPRRLSIAEEALPRGFDLIIWGHEHESFE